MTTTLVRRPTYITLPDYHANRKDPTTRWVALIAGLISTMMFGWFSHLGDILVYKDAISHMEIARRVVDSPTPGAGQLGGVWLPLPHILMLPLVWFDPFYYSGFAGSIVSMAAYVVSSVLIYKIVHDLTGDKLAALIGTAVFMLNPNILYMQSTPMTELLLFAGLLGMVYGVQRWIKTDRHGYLMAAGGASLFACLARYEAWVLLGTLVLVITYVQYGRFHGRQRSFGTQLAFLSVAAAGILLWCGWNQAIFGNALNFQDGQYAKPSLWVGSGERSVGHMDTSFGTYWYAMTDNLGVIIVALMAAGVVVTIVQRNEDLELLAPLSLLVFFPFFMVALFTGQRPLHIDQIEGNLYNVRFGLLMILPAAILIGCLAAYLRSVSRWLIIGLAMCLIIGLFTFLNSGITTLKEPEADLSTGYTRSSEAVSSYLRVNYHGGIVLMESFGNELILPDAHVDLGNNLYEGSYRMWQPALANPAGSNVRWIVMRHSADGSSDLVYDKLHGSLALQAYRLAYRNDTYYVYEMRTS